MESDSEAKVSSRILFELAMDGLDELANTDADRHLSLEKTVHASQSGVTVSFYVHDSDQTYTAADVNFREIGPSENAVVIERHEGKRYMTDVSDYSSMIKAVFDLFKGFEDAGERVSCKEMNVLNAPIAKVAGSSPRYIQDALSVPRGVYHTDDSDFDSLKDGSLFARLENL